MAWGVKKPNNKIAWVPSVNQDLEDNFSKNSDTPKTSDLISKISIIKYEPDEKFIDGVLNQ